MQSCTYDSWFVCPTQPTAGQLAVWKHRVCSFTFLDCPREQSKASICTSLMRGPGAEGFSIWSSDSSPVCWNGAQSRALHSLSLNYPARRGCQSILLPQAQSVPGAFVFLRMTLSSLSLNLSLAVAKNSEAWFHHPPPKPAPVLVWEP